MVPIILSGTTRLGKVGFCDLCLDVIKAPIQPIILSHKLAAAKLIRKNLLKNGDMKLATSYHNICNKIKYIEEEIGKQSRIHTG